MSYEPLDQPMPDPDWGRVLVNTAQKKAPSGDPTLWANTITTLIDDAAEGADPRAIYGAQIVLAQAADRYARSWSISGALTLTEDAWFAAPTSLPPDAPTAEFGRPDLAVYLSITQGIEKVTLEHQICLMYGGTSSNTGLCNNQCTINGGPYLPIQAGVLPTGKKVQSRAFAAIGSLIGNTISVRGLFVRYNHGEIDIPSATISLLLTPHAAGSGI